MYARETRERGKKDENYFQGAEVKLLISTRKIINYSFLNEKISQEFRIKLKIETLEKVLRDNRKRLYEHLVCMPPTDCTIAAPRNESNGTRDVG